jgi:hypothetical protein
MGAIEITPDPTPLLIVAIVPNVCDVPFAIARHAGA